MGTKLRRRRSLLLKKQPPAAGSAAIGVARPILYVPFAFRRFKVGSSAPPPGPRQHMDELESADTIVVSLSVVLVGVGASASAFGSRLPHARSSPPSHLSFGESLDSRKWQAHPRL